VIVSNFQPLRETQPRYKVPPSGSGLADRFEPNPVLDPNLPDLSGFARQGRQFLAVTDAKAESPNPRLGTIDSQSGAFQPLSSQWGEGAPARDLEAITAVQGQAGRFLAVEGSSWQEQSARLFQLHVDDQGSRTEQAYTLPKFSQEIEGLVEMPLDENRRLIVLGGRGGEQGQAGRLYWGVLDQQTNSLNFPPQGLEGTEVKAPRLSTDRQRDISELHLRPDGSLWASATADLGDEGPFESSIYRLGTLKPDLDNPLEASGGPSIRLQGTKIEGLVAHGRGWLTGADNESLGGQVGYLTL
jgi:hypothetical protein